MTTAYTASNPVPMGALPTTSGTVQRFLVGVTNTGTSTYAPDGLTAAPIFGLGGQQAQGGEIVANGIATLVSYVGSLLNAGNLCWILFECTAGAQQVGTATASLQAAQAGQISAGSLYTSTAGGTANAITASFPASFTSFSNGQPFSILSSTTNTGAMTAVITLGGAVQSSVPIVKANNQPVVVGDFPAGYPGEFNYSTSFSALVMQNPATNNTISAGAVAGSMLNLVGTGAGGTKTASWTAEQLVAASSLSGSTVLGTGLSLAFNGATTGAGGMDTGSVPASGNLYIYAIYKPGTGWNTLGTISGSGASIYTGISMPTGYIYSALIFTNVTDSSANIRKFFQQDRNIWISSTAVAINIVSSTSYLAQSLAAIVPPNAKTVSGNVGSTITATRQIIVSADSTGLAQQRCSFPAFSNSTDGLNGAEAFSYLPIITTQTMYWKSDIAEPDAIYGIQISGYAF